MNLADGRHYVFVDTPGFNNTHQSDRDVIQTISDWLEAACAVEFLGVSSYTNFFNRYRAKVKLTGVIYTHRATDYMSGTLCRNFDMFSRLCGEKAAERVRLVTTMWDKVKDVERVRSVVSLLEGETWKPLLDAGARHEKFENSPKSAWDIVMGLGVKTEALLLQEELVDAERRLNETTVGQTLYSQYQKRLDDQRETIKGLAEEVKRQRDPKMARELQDEYRRIEAQLHKTMEEKEILKIPLGRQISLIFTKKPAR